MATPRVTTMSNETLIKNAEAIGAEIERRVEELEDGLKHLGASGLKLHAEGKKQAVCKFPGTSKKYVYNVPLEAEVGDMVRTPPSMYGSSSLAEIVALGSNGYTGHVKDVTELFKPTHRKQV